MAEYQNIFTQVQVHGPAEMGVVESAARAESARRSPASHRWPGWFGNAQIGPVHLGSFGLIAVIGFGMWFFIIGMNFWDQADYSTRRLPARSVLDVARAADRKTMGWALHR